MLIRTEEEELKRWASWAALKLDYNETTPEERDYPKFDYQKALDKAVANGAAQLCKNGMPTPKERAKKKEYDEAVDKTSTEVYRIEKERLDSIINNPQVDRLIPKQYWTDFSLLVNTYAAVGAHPHSLFAQEKMIEIMEGMERAEVLIIVPCTASKPYSAVGRNRRFIEASNATRLFDFMACSVVPTFLTPFDASVCYPFANYSATGNISSVAFHRVMDRLSVKHLAEAIRRLDYKKVIFIHYNNLENKTARLMSEWKFSKDTIIEFHHFNLYRKAVEFTFSTRELPTPKKFHKGLVATRIVGSNAVSCFMRDIFGPAVYPYFQVGWENVEPDIKEYVGYSEDEIRKVVDYVGIERPKSSTLDSFMW